MQGATDGQNAALCRPFPFGRATLRNRIVMAPMTRNRSPGGIPGDDVLRYYARRAAGGVGLIITEGTYLDHPAANGDIDVPAFFGPALDGWRRIVEAVHVEGALIVPQLWHVGAVRRRGMQPRAEVPGMGPEEIVEAGEVVVERMGEQQLREVAQSYARAAASAEALGFDGVEIHGAHCYLIDQFLWELTNRREDAYGGSIENRTRFAVEVVTAVRRAVSRDFPVIFRYSQWKVSDYAARIANDPEELGRILNPLARAGVDIFHPSTRRYWEPAFEGSAESLPACTRRVSGKPVIAVGSIGLSGPYETRLRRTPENIRAQVADLGPVLDGMACGDFDLIAVGRGMLADADWADKVCRGDTAALLPLTETAWKTLL